MKKFKFPIFLILFAVSAILAVSTFEVVAYMVHQNQTIQNQFIPGNVECCVKENFQSDIKTSVTVENTGNIDAYVRLKVVSYWEDSKGYVVGRSSPEILFGNGWSYNTDQWLYDSNEQTFYYKKVLAAGQTTEDLLELTGSFQGIHLEKKVEIWDNITYTYHPVIEFIAEAIQSQPSESPIPVENWGITLDNNGNIVAP